jgi:signal transduction histidine kinase
MNNGLIIRISSKVKTDILTMLIGGLLSLIFGQIRLYIPGYEHIITDLREIPLIIAVIRFTNPIYAIGLSLLTIINLPEEYSYLVAFSMHFISLYSIWYLFNIIRKKELNVTYQLLLSLIFIVGYYLLLFIPINIIGNYLIGRFNELNFLSLYTKLIVLASTEWIITAIVVSIYFLLYKSRLQLKIHNDSLEKKVLERTIHLESVIEELKTTQNYLIQSEKMNSIGTLASGVAHEINNPLNFIAGGLQIIETLKLENEKNLSEEIINNCSTATNTISEGVSRTAAIVSALSSFARKGKSTLELCNINSIIDNTLLFMKSNISEDIIISKQYRIELIVPVYIEKMHQVFYNIFNNAFFELSTNTIEKKEIQIETDIDDQMAIIKVSNNGPKIPTDYLNQIFDPFFTTKDPDKGKGLGLSICYSILKEHNGKIYALNTEKGVAFIIELPMTN